MPTETERIRAHARELAEAAPPIPDEVRHRLRGLLRREAEVPATRQRCA